MSALSSIVKTSKFIPTVVGELVGYTQLNGKPAMKIKRLDTSEVLTISQGKAPSDDADLKRNTIETFANPQSTKYMKEGAVFCFDNVKITDSKAECVYINDIYGGPSDKERTYAFLYAKPLPSRNGVAYGHIEAMLKDRSKKAASEKEFTLAVLSSYAELCAYESSIGIKKFNQPIIYLTDGPTTKPIKIYVKNIKLEDDSYRRPDIKELKQQLLENSVFMDVINAYRAYANNGGEFAINVIPGIRVYASEKTVSSKRYKGALKFHSSKFSVDVDGEVKVVDDIGFKNTIVAFWNGSVNNIRSIDNSEPTLNDYPESKAVAKFGQDKEKVTATRHNAVSEASNAAMAFDSVSVGSENSHPDEAYDDHHEASYEELEADYQDYMRNRSLEVQAKPEAKELTSNNEISIADLLDMGDDVAQAPADISAKKNDDEDDFDMFESESSSTQASFGNLS